MRAHKMAANQNRPPDTKPDTKPGIKSGIKSGTEKNPGKQAVLEALRRRIRAVECLSAPGAPGVLTLGAAAADRALPWGGLPLGRLHEITGDAAAAAGFVTALMARLAGSPSSPSSPTLLWCRPKRGIFRRALYGPGLHTLGLDPGHILLVKSRADEELLWAMEEGLRTGGLTAVLGEIKTLPPVAGRRLQLAAEESGTVCFLLRPENHPGNHKGAAVTATTRWHVTPSAQDGHWRVNLLRCKGGVPNTWIMDWDNATHTFRVAAHAGDGQDLPQDGRARAV